MEGGRHQEDPRLNGNRHLSGSLKDALLRKVVGS